MRIAYLGDIVGAAGMRAACWATGHLREAHGADVVLANAENAAAGTGLTPELYRKLKAAGIDGMTLGDHALKKRQIQATLESAGDLIRPMNWPARCWGRGSMVVEREAGSDVRVVMLMGRLFMNGPQADDPFAALDRYLEGVPDGACVIVEIHAEATSEKVALGWYANATGRVAAVVGTHTHVPTADARVLPKPGTDVSLPGSPNPFPGGTAYVTDLGMTGPDDSVLGRRVDRVLTFMTTATPAPFDVAEGRPAAHGVLIDVDERTGRASEIERFDLAMPIDA
ncbi:MAG: TIGR00282 family metallophosphoesterase [Planctomycetota bacterium]